MKEGKFNSTKKFMTKMLAERDLEAYNGAKPMLTEFALTMMLLSAGLME